jgi:tetratricopeptide (TPR) repeat protein
MPNRMIASRLGVRRRWRRGMRLAALQADALLAALLGSGGRLTEGDRDTVAGGKSARRGGVSTQTGIFVRHGEYWTVGYGGTTFSLKDIKGLGYVRRLLEHPGEEFHALDLQREPGATIPFESAAGGDLRSVLRDPAVSVGGPGDAGEMLDAQAKQNYKRRLSELREQLEDFQERGNLERAAEVKSEVEFLARELARAVGFGGRSRHAGSASERARLSVTRAIKAAIQKISEHDASLGKLLEDSIRTGTFCSYAAHPRVAVSWQFAPEGLDRAPHPEATAPLLFRRETSLLAAHTERTEFVGREAERFTLRHSLEQSLRGEGRAAMIGGAAGVGKSRMAFEFAEEASQRGVLALAGACYDRGDSVPFEPFVEILELALAQAPSQQAFREMLSDDAPELARLMPQLRRLYPDIPPPLELSAEQSRRLMFNACAAFFARMAARRPLLVLLEDLHWADEGTLSLLSYLARSLSKTPAMIVGIYRDYDLDPAGALARTVDDLIRLHIVDRINLVGLPQNAVAEMIRAMSGHEPPQAVVNLIYSNTEGKPFFVEELFRHLVEQGKLTDSRGEFRGDLKLVGIDVPPSLQLVIGRRLARLSDRAQKVLCPAAVIGRSFAFELLQKACEMDADSLLDCVEEAERAGLLSSTMRHPEVRFQFSHELIRRAVIGGISPPRRQRLHLAVADAIERLYGDNLDDHAEDLAHHLWHAGTTADAGRTIRYLRMAGEKAVQRSATVEAVSYFRNALRLVTGVSETPESLQQELMLHTALGTALVATKGFTSLEVGRVFARARELSQRVGEVPQLFRALWGLWINYASRGEYRAGFEVAEQCLRLAQSAGEPGLLMEAHHALGVSCCTAGEFVRAREHLEQAIAIYDPGQHDPLRYIFGQDPAVACLVHLGWALWFLGYPDQALKRNDEGIALARRLKHPASLATAAAFGAWPYQLCRDAKAVEELAGEAVAVSTEHDSAFNRAIGVVLGGWALTQRELKEEGIAQMCLGLEAFRAADAVVMLPYFSSLLADVYGEIGQASEGLRVLAALDHSRERYWVAELHRLKGELILKQKADQVLQHVNEASAKECFRQALAVARKQNAKSLELRAAMSMSRLRSREGKRSEARQILEEVLSWFTEGFDTADLREAKMFLEGL